MVEKELIAGDKLYSWNSWENVISESVITKVTPQQYRVIPDVCHSSLVYKTDRRIFISKKALIKHKVKEAENNVETMEKRLTESELKLKKVCRWADAEFNKLAGENE